MLEPCPKRAAPGKINKEINNIIDGNIKEGRAETNKVSLTQITSSVWFLKMRFINSWINKKSKLINDWVSPLYFVYMSVTKSMDSWINGSDDWLSISETDSSDFWNFSQKHNDCNLVSLFKECTTWTSRVYDVERLRSVPEYNPRRLHLKRKQ